MIGAYLLPGVYCERCVKAGHPPHFGSLRRCGFTPDGKFKTDNWNCETLNELRRIAEANHRSTRYNDVSICYVPVANGGFAVLSWYKDRGRVDNAIVMLDSPDAHPLTLKQAESACEEGVHGYEDD
jgi:hypothetical protein